MKNRYLALTLTAVLASLSAIAHADTTDTTREKVLAELHRARDAGELNYSYEVLGIAQPVKAVAKTDDKATRTATASQSGDTPATNGTTSSH